QVGAYAFHPSGMAQAADLPVQSVAEIQSADACTGLLQAADQRLLRLPLALDETVWVAVEGQATAHDGLATGRVDLRTEAHEQAEAVASRRAQFALLRVHGADQSDTCLVRVGDAVAFDAIDPAGADIEQQIHQRVSQQVDLVDIQHAAVGPSQQARF